MPTRVRFLLLLCASAWPATVLAQLQSVLAERSIEVEYQPRSSAVMVTRVAIGDVDVQCGLMIAPNKLQAVVPFQADGDWLKNLKIYLYNRTDLTIVAVNITLGFPETGDGKTRPQLMYPVQLGRLPSVVAVSGSTGKLIPQDSAREPLKFLPNETLQIDVGNYFDDFKEHIQTFAEINKVFIYVGPFFFESGMRWSAGKFSVPDPERKGRFKRMDDDYFPGDVLRNWPPVSQQ